MNQITTRAIVVGTTKYGDTSLIVKLFTREAGLRSYMLKGVRKAKKGKIRASYFQPLSLLRVEARHKDREGLDYLVDVNTHHPITRLHTEVIHSTLALFLSECLMQVFRESEKDEDLFDMLEQAIIHMDSTDRVYNHHLKILAQTTMYLGFFPDTTSMGESFNLIDGYFDDEKLAQHHASPVLSDKLRELLGTGFDDLSELRMSRDERTGLLSLLLDYYAIHLHGFRRPTSQLVLSKIFT